MHLAARMNELLYWPLGGREVLTEVMYFWRVTTPHDFKTEGLGPIASFAFADNALLSDLQ